MSAKDILTNIINPVHKYNSTFFSKLFETMINLPVPKSEDDHFGSDPKSYFEDRKKTG